MSFQPEGLQANDNTVIAAVPHGRMLCVRPAVSVASGRSTALARRAFIPKLGGKWQYVMLPKALRPHQCFPACFPRTSFQGAILDRHIQDRDPILPPATQPRWQRIGTVLHGQATAAARQSQDAMPMAKEKMIAA